MNVLNTKYLFSFLLGFLICFFTFSNFVFASETVGSIDSVSKYAWGENYGWFNFGCDNCDVVITDSSITGYAWNKQYGWIKLNPDNPSSSLLIGVRNDGEGNLSGNAWGSNIGWIDFSGVTIDSNGDFSGYATVSNDNSEINFNCDGLVDSCSSASFKLNTDWRPQSARTTVDSNTSNGTSGSIVFNNAKSIVQNIFTPLKINFDNFSNTKIVDNLQKENINNENDKTFLSLINKSTKFFANLFRFGKRNENINTPVIVKIPNNPQMVFKPDMNLLPVKNINKFVFSPLPYDVRNLAMKFPEIDNTFKKVGVEKITDIDKLYGVDLDIPSLSNINKNIALDLDIKNNISLEKGIPVDSFPNVVKQKIPTEFVFARAQNELIDLNVSMSVEENDGRVIQTIDTLPGQNLKLVIKPIGKAKEVTGYFVFKEANSKVSKEFDKIPRSTLVSSAIFSMAGIVEAVESEELDIEKKFVISSFKYIDDDGDGIYTANITTPVVPGQYEILTTIDYIDPELGTRRMSMITLIDPEGYIYEKNNGKETRIPDAIVSLYELNTNTNTYELWNAKDYQQKNPQITDLRGTYSFLVPEGKYYFVVEAPGYNTFEGKVFSVIEGASVHENIELKPKGKVISGMDNNTLLIIVVLLLIIYNLFRDFINIKLLKLIKKDGNK